MGRNDRYRPMGMQWHAIGMLWTCAGDAMGCLVGASGRAQRKGMGRHVWDPPNAWGGATKTHRKHGPDLGPLKGMVESQMGTTFSGTV